MPFLGWLAKRIARAVRGAPLFTSSGEYWETRYRRGGNSGAGSYDDLAAFKGEIINAFVSEHQIETVIELGCGDGNQLGYFQLKSYIGYDVSRTAVAACTERYRSDPSKQFRLLTDDIGEKADLTLSLDVIYHLTEEPVYQDHMRKLFASSEKFVIIYSSNLSGQENDKVEPHIRHRRFTDWVERHASEFTLIGHIPNKYPFNGDEVRSSVADFYIYQKQN